MGSRLYLDRKGNQQTGGLRNQGSYRALGGCPSWRTFARPTSTRCWHRSGVRLRVFPLTVTTEQLPAHQELRPELRHTAGGQAEFLGHVQRSFAEQEVIDDTTVTLAAAANPQREVK